MKFRSMSKFKAFLPLIAGIALVPLIVDIAFMLLFSSSLLGLLPVGFGPGGMGDWAYDQLPNGYEIWRLNSRNIQVVKGNGTVILDGYVLEFCYNESFIGIKHISTDEGYSRGQSDTKNLDTSNPDFYLIDAQNDAVCGPLTADDYQKQLQTRRIQDMCGWIPTVPTPDGAIA